MSLFDRLRPKWKHADPGVRAAAVRELEQQDILASIVADDPAEEVRRAAVETLTDQDALVQIAQGTTNLALVAVGRLTAAPALARVALKAEQAEVRLRAVERIADTVILQRIAGFDPDPAVRRAARARSTGADHARRIIREVLSRLSVAETKATDHPEISGSLDAVCHALIQDPRFAINGGVVEDEETRTGSTGEATTALRGEARFLAQTRSAAGGPAPGIRFYQIKVWRTEQDAFGAVAEEKSLAFTNNAVVWSKASSGSPETRPMTKMTPPAS